MDSLPRARTAGRLAPVGRLVAWGFLAVVLLASSAAPAASQFGAFKKLKKAKQAMSAVTASDSAVVADSLAKLQADTNEAVANGETVPADSAAAKGKKKGFLRRAASSAVKASDKFEDVTGVSVKDAAIAATGVGVAGIVTKKLGVDPSSVVGNAVGNAVTGAESKAMDGVVQGATQGAIPGLSGMPGIPGIPSTPGAAGMPNAATIQAMQAMQGAAAANAGQAAMMTGTPDAQLMLAFQQEMMQVTMAATTGDAAARAKLDAWQTMSEKFEGEAAKLNGAIVAGDATAYVKLQKMQTKLMREWMDKYAAKRPAVKP